MARYSLGARMTNAPTSTLPGMSLYSGSSSVGLRLRELWIFNTTATACQVALQRLTTAGTQGTGLTELAWDNISAPVTTGFQSHTVGPTITTGYLAIGSLGAAIGGAVVWSFGDAGIVVPAGTGNGLGITTPTGTGQVCDVYWVWDE